MHHRCTNLLAYLAAAETEINQRIFQPRSYDSLTPLQRLLDFCPNDSSS
jgi:hypothetical protein